MTVLFGWCPVALNVLQVAKYAVAEVWVVESASLRFSGHNQLHLFTQCALQIVPFSAGTMVWETVGKCRNHQRNQVRSSGLPTLPFLSLPQLWPLLCELAVYPPALHSDPSLPSVFSISLKRVTILYSQFSKCKFVNSFLSLICGGTGIGFFHSDATSSSFFLLSSSRSSLHPVS